MSNDMFNKQLLTYSLIIQPLARVIKQNTLDKVKK